jgi:hypothetical protein
VREIVIDTETTGLDPLGGHRPRAGHHDADEGDGRMKGRRVSPNITELVKVEGACETRSARASRPCTPAYWVRYLLRLSSLALFALRGVRSAPVKTSGWAVQVKGYMAPFQGASCCPGYRFARSTRISM